MNPPHAAAPHHLLCRQLQLSQKQNGGLAPPADAGADGGGAAAVAALAESRWRCLEAAFRACPRVVLAACLQCLKDTAGSLHPLASQFVGGHLLAPPPPDMQQAAQQAQHATLAAAVLAARPGEQRWLTQHAQQHFMQAAATSERGRAARALVEKLLQQLPQLGRKTLAAAAVKEAAAAAAASSSPSRRSGRSSSERSPAAAGGAAGKAGSRRSREEAGLPRGASPGRPSRMGRWTEVPPLLAEPSGRSPKRGAGAAAAPAALAAAAATTNGGGRPHRAKGGSSEPDEGELPGDARGMLLQLPEPGGDVCVAAACLHFTGLPRELSAAALRAECSRHGRVDSVVLPPAPAPDDSAFVTFGSVRFGGGRGERGERDAPERWRKLWLRLLPDLAGSRRVQATALQPYSPTPDTCLSLRLLPQGRVPVLRGSGGGNALARHRRRAPAGAALLRRRRGAAGRRAGAAAAADARLGGGRGGAGGRGRRAAGVPAGGPPGAGPPPPRRRPPAGAAPQLWGAGGGRGRGGSGGRGVRQGGSGSGCGSRG